MVRIYLDSNIFRFLKKADTDFYQSLDSSLRKYSDRLIYYYSHAHLLDLKRDKSDKKKDDLIFMEEFVQSNYLALGWKEEFVNVQIATPTEAFEGIGEDIQITDYINLDAIMMDLDVDSNPELSGVKSMIEGLMALPINLGLASNIASCSDEEKKLWQNLIPNIKDEYTLGEWLEQFSLMYENLFDDSTQTYKELRRFFIENFNLAQKFNIDIEKIDFDTALKDTPLQNSFTEFVNKSIENSSNTIQREFDFLMTAFQTLNILGVDREKNKKAKFANNFNDAQHAYYSAHCDVLVSDDVGFLLKSKVMYKLLGIETKVLHVEEFAAQIGVIAGVLDSSIDSYLKSLSFDLSNSLVVDTKPSFQYKRLYTTIKPFQRHFAYFNALDVIKDYEAGVFVVLYQNVKNYSRFVSYKEFEEVTNKVVRIFGVDDNLRGYYTERDTSEIQNGNWKGRVWTIDKLEITLDINIGTRKFNLSIFFLPN